MFYVLLMLLGLLQPTWAAPTCIDVFSQTQTADTATPYEDLASFLTLKKNIFEKDSAYHLMATHYDGRYKPTVNLLTQYRDLGFNVIERFYWIQNPNTGAMVPINGTFYNSRVQGFSLDGKEIRITDAGVRDFTVSTESRNRIYSTVTGELLRELSPSYDGKGKLQFQVSDNFQVGAIKNTNNTVSIYDVSTPTQKLRFTAKGSEVVFSADGKQFTVKDGSQMTLYRLGEQAVTKVTTLSEFHNGFKEIFSPDGRYLVVKDGLTTMGVYSTLNGKLVSRFKMVWNYGVKVSPNGEYIALFRGNTVIVRSTSSGEIINTFTVEAYKLQQDLHRVYFSADSSKIGLSNVSVDMYVWTLILDIPTGTIDIL